MMVDGIFGYSTYDAVQYFEDITFPVSLCLKRRRSLSYDTIFSGLYWQSTIFPMS